MTRGKHPNKEIEKALREVEAQGWRVEESRGGSAHCWGRMYCPYHSRGGCIVSIFCTPRVPEHHAEHLRREMSRCPH